MHLFRLTHYSQRVSNVRAGTTLQFCADRFVKRYDPTIEDSYRKIKNIWRRRVVYDILDTAGQTEFDSQRLLSDVSEAQAFLIMYDVTQPETFKSVDAIFQRIVACTARQTQVNVVLVGNKVDLLSSTPQQPCELLDEAVRAADARSD